MRTFIWICGTEFKADREFIKANCEYMLEAVKQCGHPLRRVAPELKRDREFNSKP